MLEKIKKISILYDFYGELLPEKQRDIFCLYYEDNYSLAEIGEDYGITRQGVHEAIKRSEEKLQEYEKKLGLVEKFRNTEDVLLCINNEIQKLILEFDNNLELKSRFQGMKAEIAKLNQ